MSFKQGLIRARSHIIFILALITAFGIVITIERIDFEHRVSARVNIKNDIDIEVPGPRPLTKQELTWAKTAWTYFKNNTIAETGMVNSVDGYEASTLWDTASYLMGLIAAHKLSIVSDAEFEDRTHKLLDSLAKLPLYEDFI